jgi:hypothetical protein
MTKTKTNPGLCAECVEAMGDTNPNSRCAHEGGHATAFDGGHAWAFDGGHATAFGGGHAWAFDGGNAVADGGNARAIGGGTETDHRGTRRPVPQDGIDCDCLAGDGWLRVGCELRRYEEWIEKADEIGEKHGGGIAHLTRALAQRLIDGEDEG